MFRIDSEGATAGNRFTEGDPALSIPATVVSAKFLNHVQEEIIKPIEEMDLALDDTNEGLLYSSLLEFFLRGGRKNSYNSSLANNSGPFNLEDTNNGNAKYTVDKTAIKNRICFFDIERKTDSNIVKEFGILFIAYDSKNDAFLAPKVFSLNDDAGVTFSLAVGDTADEFDLQATTDDLTGTSYVGRIDITSIFEIKQ